MVDTINELKTRAIEARDLGTENALALYDLGMKYPFFPPFLRLISFLSAAWLIAKPVIKTQAPMMNLGSVSQSSG